MSMKEFLGKGKGALTAAMEKVADEWKSGLSVISEVINGLPIFMSSVRSKKFETQFDEKHYFVIPYALAEAQFTLHTMRCLPEGALEVNDLPKRRVFHFPNAYYEAALREQMVEAAKSEAVEAHEGKVHRE